MRRFATTLLLTTGAFAASLDNVTVERTGPGIYRLEFSQQDAGPIEVFADANAAKIVSMKPVAKVKQSPAEIRMAEPNGRVYFHLKPERGRVRTVATRSPNLEGAANFRDLGGYRTADGKFTRWGLVYRSNNLASVTEKDYEFLASIKLKLVCDVRVNSERTRQPTEWRGARPEFLLAPIGDEDLIRNASATFLQNGAATQSSLVSETRGYEQLIVDYVEQYAKVFHRIIAGELPMVFHCSAGRDRTGTFAALLLTMLNVPRETVVQDYLLTSKYLLADAAIDRMASDLQKSINLPAKPSAALLRERLAMSPAVMESTFKVIDEHYGSFDKFRRDVLHISDAELAKMRELLTEQ